MAQIQDMTIRVLCALENISLVRQQAKIQHVEAKEFEGPFGVIYLEMTASIPTLFQIAYQCGQLEIGITVS